MVLATYNFTAFQRGLERLGGRAVGVVLGIAFVTVCRDIPILSLLLQGLVLLPCFYVYFAGRLAYAALNAGLYFAAMILIGQENPEAVTTQGLGLLCAIAVGVLIAELGAWLTGLEQDLRHPHRGGVALAPATRLGQPRNHDGGDGGADPGFLTHWMQLPAEKAIISVMILTGVADVRQLLAKGEMRALGAILGSAWAFGSFLLLSLSPHFLLLAGLLFTGIFIAAYVAHSGHLLRLRRRSDGPGHPVVAGRTTQEFGNLTGGVQRLLGVAIAMVVSLVVIGLWPRITPPPQR